tara:strand:+ start:9081 stop:9491 length:411 start_codon:yes stop_codon:yes gene_type:complete
MEQIEALFGDYVSNMINLNIWRLRLKELHKEYYETWGFIENREIFGGNFLFKKPLTGDKSLTSDAEIYLGLRNLYQLKSTPYDDVQTRVNMNRIKNFKSGGITGYVPKRYHYTSGINLRFTYYGLPNTVDEGFIDE